MFAAKYIMSNMEQQQHVQLCLCSICDNAVVNTVQCTTGLAHITLYQWLPSERAPRTPSQMPAPRVTNTG
jgi:hypothetical protein